MTTVAIIPARGGSKRLPGKNIKLLAGKPLIAWTIEAAIESNCFDQVVVSTENNEIAELAKQYGAEVPCLRPGSLATDETPTGPVLEHMIKVVEENANLNVGSVCLLQPTSPLRTVQNIIESKKLFDNKSADAVVSVVESDSKPAITNYLTKNLSLKGFLTAINRTQEADTLYQLNGAIYWVKRELVEDLLKIYQSDKSFAYLMSRENSVDIDTDFDFAWAEFLLQSQLDKRIMD
ncbi:MAG: CMP-N-acetlyneuraminic acid synthetase [Idiomarinaceae bacterium]|nr:CMP-N-acetlyneuraminic acid synthetase [Idiomarinaceae bacterium]HAD48652.1 hypothetical protein [Idiomarina sp.]